MRHGGEARGGERAGRSDRLDYPRRVARILKGQAGESAIAEEGDEETDGVHVRGPPRVL